MKKMTQPKDDDDQENESDEDEDAEIDEEEMIDVAEKIFVRMASQMFDMKVSVRSAFKDHIFPVEVNNETLELISPMGFLEGVKTLGIDDLREIEVTYLLKVLSKSELDGAIMLEELLQIMANFGLFDEDGEGEVEGEGEGEGDVEGEEEDQTDNSPGQGLESSPESTKKAGKKKKNAGIDLTKLDNESIEIMAMLMLYCIKNGITAHKVFEEVLFLQNIKSKSKHQTVEIMKAADFYKTLAENHIRQSEDPHDNLQDFLQLSPNFPELLTLKAIKKTLEAM